MIRMTLNCVILTQSSVIQTTYCNVGLTCFFNFTKMFVCCYSYVHIFHWYLTR